MNSPNLVSILMPLYNEEELVGLCIERVMRAPLPEGLSLELVIVDDGSTDDSIAAAESMLSQYPDRIRIIRHEKNQGKGAAIQTALKHANGEYCIIQDADLEYDPADYMRLLNPLLEQGADAVFGSRFLGTENRRVLYFWHSIANGMLTTLSNMFSDLNLTDMETCYKAVRTSLLKSIPLRSNRFGIEPEMTLKLAQRRARIYEVPISYNGRTYEEGKKIGLKDAFQALYTILRYGLTRDIYADGGAAILDTLSGTHKFNRWMADTIRPHVGQHVLEIGAGIGNLTRQLHRKRKLYVATDLDKEHLSRLINSFVGRRNLSFHQCDLMKPEDFVPLKEVADTVICLNVVEHVPDDLLALRNIHSALKPGGTAIVLVPQGMSNYGTLDEVLGHYRRYSQKELREKMEQCGFGQVKIIEFNRVTWPGWFVNGRIFKKTTFSRFQLFCFDNLVPVWRKIDSFLPWPSVSIIAVATKN